MKEKEKETKRLHTLLRILLVALCLLPGSALAEILNNGYPYGKNMTESSITLVIKSDNPYATYQWQVANSSFDSFEGITGETQSTYTFSPSQSTDSGKRYRCVVDGKESHAVMIVYPKKDGRTWTKYHSSWYITNGIVAYMANDTIFDVIGLYEKNNTAYMLCTSYGTYWNMYSRSLSDPEGTSYSSDSYSAKLDALRISFSESDPYSVNFEADLQSTERAFCIGCDTQIGNSSTSGDYYDDAALSALMDGNSLKQVAMIGAGTIQGAPADAPSFVIRPVDSCSKFWIGRYSDRMNYAYNLSSGSIVNLIEGIDSGMTMSWTYITPGGSVRFQFRVGNVANTGAIGCKVNYFDEKLVELNANATYYIQIKGDTSGTVYQIQANADGKIPLAGMDIKNQTYDFIGQTLEIAKANNIYSKMSIDIADRPDAVLPTKDQISIGTDKVTFTYVEGQKYEYSKDSGRTWTELTNDNSSSGSYEISGLSGIDVVQIRAYVLATSNAPRSNISNPQSVTLLKEINVMASDIDREYNGTNIDRILFGDNMTDVSVLYKLLPDGQSSSSLPEMKNVGTYTVECYLSKTGYADKTVQVHVKITPRPITVIFADTTRTYTGSAVAGPTVTWGNTLNNHDDLGSTLTYTSKADSGAAYNSTTPPTQAGEYVVTASINNGNYLLTGTRSADFTITKAPITPSVTIADWVYKATPSDPQVSGNKGNGAVTYEYKTNGADDSTYTANKPTQAGAYTVRASIAETANYQSATALFDFNVLQSATEIVDVTVNEQEEKATLTYGDTVVVKASVNATGRQPAALFSRSAPQAGQMALYDAEGTQISEAVSADNTGVYTMTVDTKSKALSIGDNLVTLKYFETTNMANATQSVTITLNKKLLTIDEVTTQERGFDPANRRVRVTDVKLSGKETVSGAEDDVALNLTDLEAEVPQVGAGDYDKVTLPADLETRLTGKHAQNYTIRGGEVSAKARIAKLPIMPTITIENWVTGDEPSKPVVTGNPGNGAVTITYKPREGDVTDYRLEVPTQPGEYTVRAIVAETANYQEGQARAFFIILPRTDVLPQTGDRSRLALWLGVLALAGTGAVIMLRRRKGE